MKVLITGSKGFVGKNLTSTLEYLNQYEILTFDREDDLSLLYELAAKCDFVVHLAGVNRPENKEEFKKGNVTLVENLIKALKKSNNKAPILVTSSIQAELNNDYGKSKKAGEDLLIKYGKENNAKILIYRLPNLFGKWSKPHYNSVVATWCYQIARNKEIEISDKNHQMTLVYIDDLIKEILAAINNNANQIVDNYYSVLLTYKITLEDLAKTLKAFKESRNNRFIPNMNDPLTSKLYSTYLNFLPVDKFKYKLQMHKDSRGSFTEFIKSNYAGQVSINISAPHEKKGEHWHHSKNEKFLVVKGEGLVKFRNIFDDKVIEYRVSDKNLEVIDIPTGYTHNIVNLTNEDMITVMWVNQPYNPDNPDTYLKKVKKEDL